MLPHNCFYLDADCAARAMDSLYGYAILEDGIVLGSGGLAEWRRDNPEIAFPAMDGRFACVLRETSSGTPPSRPTRHARRSCASAPTLPVRSLSTTFSKAASGPSRTPSRFWSRERLPSGAYPFTPPPQSPFTSRAACTWANNLRRLILWSKKCECSQPLRRFAWIWAQITRKYSILLLWIFLKAMAEATRRLFFDFISQARGVLAALLPMAPCRAMPAFGRLRQPLGARTANGSRLRCAQSASAILACSRMLTRNST